MTETKKPWNKMNMAERTAYAREREAARLAATIGPVEPLAPEDPEAPIESGEGGESGEDSEAEVLQVMAAERRARLLHGISADVAALISDDELDEIEREEREAAEAARKDRALKDVRAQMRQRARVDNDLISADVLRSADEKKRLAEMVTFRVNLPGSGSGHQAQHGFHVDGVWYQHGFVYTKPRAIYESLLGMHYRAHLNETIFRTLDQHKPGSSAIETLQSHIPQFEVHNAA